MKRWTAIVLAAALVLALSLIAALIRGKPDGASQENARAVTVARISLPQDPVLLPETEAGALVSAKCTACHSAEMIVTQPTMPADKWRASIAKMRDVYHASIAPDEDAVIASALVALQRPRRPAAPGS